MIPGKHELTTLIIRQCHHAVLHNGLKETLAQVRTKYWIIRGRQIVKSVISKCTTCKRHQGTPYSAPTIAPLPEFRICVSNQFDKTGVDFCGPVYIKISNETESKVCIALYTCCATSAVHLELVMDLTAESFVGNLLPDVGFQKCCLTMHAHLRQQIRS